MEYVALIRTFNSLPLVLDVIAALRAQTCPPAVIMAVDSGSEPAQAAQLCEQVDQFIDVSGKPFNYARSINVGVAAASAPNVLIISSHVVVRDDKLLEDFFQELSKTGMEVGSLIAKPEQSWLSRTVTDATFTGVNGLTNSCSFGPARFFREMPFREEVFASEDQEWTRRFLDSGAAGMTIVETSRIDYLNKNFNFRKKYNEEMALATYVDRKRMGAKSILTWMLKSAWSLGVRGDRAKALHRYQVAVGLLKARFKKPEINSKYF
jgi:glycosyltransferase involved in cell wall biosynthesis